MTKTLTILLTIGFSFLMFASSVVVATAERGQDPECQKQCLANHVTAMQKLFDELAKTGKILTYQDMVELEVSSYSTCIKNCRIITPVK
jgi:hypothetical protein